MNNPFHSLRQIPRNLALFLAGMALLGACGGMFDTTFNNYVSDTFNLAADARGFLEFPRELPGFLTALFAGLLFFLPETRIAAFSSLAIGAGVPCSSCSRCGARARTC